MFDSKMSFEGLLGVGEVELDFEKDKRVYALIGTNGVGKTKTLEALFQVMFLSRGNINSSGRIGNTFDNGFFRFSRFKSDAFAAEVKYLDKDAFVIPYLENSFGLAYLFIEGEKNEYALPVVFLGAKNRGHISNRHVDTEKPLGSAQSRLSEYMLSTINSMRNDFHSINSTEVEEWFIRIAKGSHRFLKDGESRTVEITAVLNLLHQMDSSFARDFLEIDGNEKVSLKINDVICELSHLSSGFCSMLKIIQSIVSGYGYFTNETELEKVKGIVLIDEIESHLHASWQVRIMPLLKRLFPNTTFYVTTHSPLILSLLFDGEAYRLVRDADQVVRSKKIDAPNRVVLIDLLHKAFGEDLDKERITNDSPEELSRVNETLLSLLEEGV